VTRRIAFLNEKGGSCKTTLVSNLGDYLARVKGLRVLLVDLDPQGQLSKVLGVEPGGEQRTAYDLLLDAADREREPAPPPVLRARHPGLDLIVANKSLAHLPAEAAERGDESFEWLRTAIERLPGYDLVLFDAPPSFGAITLNVLMAATEVVIPVPLTYLGLDGAAEMTRTVSMVKTRFRHAELEISMVISTLGRRTRLASEVHEKLREHFPKELAQTVVGYSVLVDEAQSRGRTIFEYAPRFAPARWFAGLAEELLTRRPAPSH
jgi:chromosome partitioning protein